MILRARIVLPVSQPPIENGAVLVSGNRIAAVASWDQLPASKRDKVIDLGDVLLMPGLVNAHCHLDYTDMAGMVPPQKLFTDWIKLITAAKAEWTYSEFAASWLRGAHMLVRSGTTTVADFEAVPELLPDVWAATPLRVLSFLELTGVLGRRKPKLVLQQAVDTILSLPRGRCRAAVAPHAPYSTVPELIRRAAAVARRRKWPISIHVAESPLEFDMFKHASGDMFNWLRRNHRPMRDCGLGTPVEHLARTRALGRNLAAVHVNYLGDSDARLLARNKVSVVHCPRSHFYFKFGRFPFRALSKARVNICLGTDSLATVYKRRRENVELSMFEEMRDFAAKHPRVAPSKIVQMATVNGALALGLAGRAGQLTRRASADLIAVPFTGRLSEVSEAIIHHQGAVSASMIEGLWAIPPSA